MTLLQSQLIVCNLNKGVKCNSWKFIVYNKTSACPCAIGTRAARARFEVDTNCDQ